MSVQVIHGNPNSRVSSLVWCRSRLRKLPAGRLFSSSIDGSVYEWDLFDLTQKVLSQTLATSVVVPVLFSETDLRGTAVLLFHAISCFLFHLLVVV